jgi:hypothetical protein
MYPVFGKCLVEHLIVAAPAQFIAVSLGLEGIGGTRVTVALVAHACRDRLVNIIVKYSRHVGTMGIVATGAIGRSHRIVHVLLDKYRAIGGMATDAEGVGLVLEQKLPFCRCVGLMACKTTLLHRIVLVLIFGHRIPYGLVAVETEGIAPLHQIVLAARSMGIMALHALTIHDNLVGTDASGWNNTRMAGATDLLAVTLQELAMSCGMGIVAPRTVPFFQRRMNERLFELFLKGRMAIKAKPSVSTRLQFEFGGIVLAMDIGNGKKD